MAPRRTYPSTLGRCSGWGLDSGHRNRPQPLVGGIGTAESRVQGDKLGYPRLLYSVEVKGAIHFSTPNWRVICRFCPLSPAKIALGPFRSRFPSKMKKLCVK